MKKPKTETFHGQRVRCYDNGGETADRFTVIYLDQPERAKGHFACLGMNSEPFHPQGFGQHSTAMDGPHLGKPIAFADLPEDCRKCVLRDLKPEGAVSRKPERAEDEWYADFYLPKGSADGIWKVAYADGTAIAEIDGTAEHSERDAFLFAAAPRLLTALEALYNAAPCAKPANAALWDALQLTRAALAKARNG